MMALSSIPFCSFDGRRAGLLYIPAPWRYTTDQALIYPTELAGHASELRGREGVFVHGGDLLSDERNLREYRVPIVAGGGRWRRCHLVTQGRLNEREGPRTQRVA